MLDHSQRRFLSRRAWQLYPAFYALGVYFGFRSPMAIPLLVAAPLLGVALIFTLFEWHGLRRAGLIACAVALGQGVLAWLLLLLQPESLVIGAWAIAMITPLALTVSMLRLARRSPSPAVVTTSVLFVAATAAACAGDTREKDSTGARVEVAAAVDRYVAASRTVNADSIAAFFAPNGVLFEPGIPPIQSADSIRKFMASFPGVQVESASVTLDTIEVHDSTAYVWGDYFERLSFPGQPRSEQRGRFVMEWHRTLDAWHILRYYRIPLSTIVPPPPAVP